MNAELREEQIEGLYSYLCKRPDLEGKVRALPDDSLRDLNGWLARLGIENGIPGMVWGLVMVEAAERFMTAKNNPEGTR